MIIAGTGHRPKDLPCLYNENDKWLLNIKKKLLSRLKKSNVKLVINGGAIGWDTWLAEAAIKLNIPLHTYVPFRGQESIWPYPTQKRYNAILKASEKVFYLHEQYSNQAFLDRNKSMVNDCDEIWALWNPDRQEGGTFHCINYSIKQDKPIFNFWNGAFVPIDKKEEKPLPKETGDEIDYEFEF